MPMQNPSCQSECRLGTTFKETGFRVCDLVERLGLGRLGLVSGVGLGSLKAWLVSDSGEGKGALSLGLALGDGKGSGSFTPGLARGDGRGRGVT